MTKSQILDNLMDRNVGVIIGRMPFISPVSGQQKYDDIECILSIDSHGKSFIKCLSQKYNLSELETHNLADLILSDKDLRPYVKKEYFYKNKEVSLNSVRDYLYDKYKEMLKDEQ